MYAVKINDHSVWRAADVNTILADDEFLSETQPTQNVPSKTSRIKLLQTKYEIDRNNLNMAWLSAIIADGEQETARKAIISTQMTALQAKLQADIAAILAEE